MIDIKNILAHTDHTCLKPDSTKSDIDKLIEEAEKYNTASVCIPPSFVSYASKKTKIKVCTVIGFPCGYQTQEVKVFEAIQAVNEGADEIDMVINIGDLKSNKYEKITQEIKSIKEAIGSKVLKVIVETCLLSDEEKAIITQIVCKAGGDFIKTSTGFSKEGAKLIDIEIFKNNMPNPIKIKAAGGIKTLEIAQEFLDAGCERIGASSLVKEAERLLNINN